MIRSMNNPYLISSTQVAFADYSQVSPGSQCLGKTANKHLIVHPDSKPPARHARFGYLENSGSDRPALSDKRVVDLDPLRREVFPKLAVLERSAKLLFPPPDVFNGICIDRFIRAAMRLSIRLLVSFEIYTSGLNTTAERCLPDGMAGRPLYSNSRGRPTLTEKSFLYSSSLFHAFAGS